ncbi:hypothetical protein [Alishewanella longhuensis]
MKLTLSCSRNRVVWLGLIPLVLLLAVLLGSFWAASAKDRLFNQLYDEHLVIGGCDAATKFCNRPA